MGLARRYILEVTEIIPSGITRVERTVEYDLTDAFSIVNNGGDTVSYTSITTDDLIALTDADYRTRVNDFLLNVNIESGEFTSLNDQSVFDASSC